MSKIEETLAQRGSAYGDFREQGRITQNLKRAMQDSPNWGHIPAYMREGLDMVQHKVSRLLNGNPFYDDNFHDMVGYTKLMQDRAAQDVENGLSFEGGGDPMYPVYEHESRGDVVTVGSISVPVSVLDFQNQARMHREQIYNIRRILHLTDVSYADKVAQIKDLMGDA